MRPYYATEDRPVPLDPPPLKSAPEQKDLTPKPGGILLAELFHASGCAAADETGVRNDREYSNADHVLSAVLPNTLGFDAATISSNSAPTERSSPRSTL